MLFSIMWAMILIHSQVTPIFAGECLFRLIPATFDTSPLGFQGFTAFWEEGGSGFLCTFPHETITNNIMPIICGRSF